MKPLSIALVGVVIIFVYLLTSCESAPRPEVSTQSASADKNPTPSKPPQLYTGLQAFSCVSGLAQRWSSDVMPVRLESQPNSETNGQDGKSAVWKAGFISPSRGKIKYFYCSGSRLKDAPPYGPSAGAEEPYGSDVPALGFQSLFLKTDSDKAYAVAQAHGGDRLIKKDPNQVVTYFVLWHQKQQALYWYVMYGKDKESAAGTGIVNALTGAYVGIGK